MNLLSIKQQIKVGDVVRLKSGSVIMTVTEVYGLTAMNGEEENWSVCYYYGYDGFKKHYLPHKALVIEPVKQKARDD